jgi:hypothetical protein
MLMLNNQKIFVLLGMALVVPVCADDFQVDTPDIEDGKWAVNTNLSYGFDGSADHDNDNSPTLAVNIPPKLNQGRAWSYHTK